MKITNAIWVNTLDDNFTGQLIGIVMGEDEHTSEKKAYIGIGDGADEAADVHFINKNGGKLTKHQVEILAKHFGIIQ